MVFLLKVKRTYQFGKFKRFIGRLVNNRDHPLPPLRCEYHKEQDGNHRQIQSRIVEASGLSEDEVRQIIADNTKGKTLGVFGEETVNVLGVNLDIALAMGLVGEISK